MENNITISNEVIDKALVDNAPMENLLRLKAIELAIHFFYGKSPTAVQLHETYSKLFNFLNNEQQTEKLHQRGIPQEESQV